jgi:hypothetical protein
VNVVLEEGRQGCKSTRDMVERAGPRPYLFVESDKRVLWKVRVPLELMHLRLDCA